MRISIVTRPQRWKSIRKCFSAPTILSIDLISAGGISTIDVAPGTMETFGGQREHLPGLYLQLAHACG
jgi:hypothetical protein